MLCSGRGIYIMRQVMDSVAFDMSQGTTVTMTKAG
jgi:anti-sigma regulatory factor (Ser/Thr protein kinase)